MGTAAVLFEDSGELLFQSSPQRSLPACTPLQYGMEMLVEDGSLVVRAGLDHSFIARLFGAWRRLLLLYPRL